MSEARITSTTEQRAAWASLRERLAGLTLPVTGAPVFDARLRQLALRVQAHLQAQYEAENARERDQQALQALGMDPAAWPASCWSLVREIVLTGAVTPAALDGWCRARLGVPPEAAVPEAQLLRVLGALVTGLRLGLVRPGDI
jgi:hypothetical protein